MTDLRVLFIDDSEADTLLLCRHLQAGGYTVQRTRVDDPHALRAAMKATWDLILCDYSMPEFEGPEAMLIIRRHGVDTPIFLISGAVGEELAVELMRAGANDIISKSKLTRLVPAIERELEDARSRARLRASEEALNRSERLRLLGQLTAGVAHDFGNILQPLSLHLQCIEQSLEEADRATCLAHVAKARAILKRGEQTVHRLLGYGLSRRAIGPQLLDVSALMAEAVSLAHPRLSSHGAAGWLIEQQLTSVPAVLGDASDIVNAILNLIINAIDAMTDGGTITLRTWAAEGSVLAEVEDNGPGISEELRERVFEPFHTTKGAEGTGLGLSLVRECMNRHHGHVTLRAGAEGGAIFRLQFPVAPPRAGYLPANSP